jgi:hypothetical protein
MSENENVVAVGQPHFAVSSRALNESRKSCFGVDANRMLVVWHCRLDKRAEVLSHGLRGMSTRLGSPSCFANAENEKSLLDERCAMDMVTIASAAGTIAR